MRPSVPKLVLGLLACASLAVQITSAQSPGTLRWNLRPGVVIQLQMVDTMDLAPEGDAAFPDSVQRIVHTMTFLLSPERCAGHPPPSCDNIKVDVIADSMQLVRHGKSSGTRPTNPFGTPQPALLSVGPNGEWRLTDTTANKHASEEQAVLRDFQSAMTVPLQGARPVNGSYAATVVDAWTSATAGLVHAVTTGVGTTTIIGDSLLRIGFTGSDSAIGGSTGWNGKSVGTMVWNRASGLPVSGTRTLEAMAIDVPGRHTPLRLSIRTTVEVSTKSTSAKVIP